MITLLKKIGTHKIEFKVDKYEVAEFIEKNFCNINDPPRKIDIKVKIILGYGSTFIDYNVAITKEFGKVIFRRSDYLIKSDNNYCSAEILANNELALKHALMNLYSSYIVHHNWGLLIHSSCVIENGKAHIFAGQSGAGKSTAARLSLPRDLLSDEATLVKITSDSIKIFNSPFRSEITETGLVDCVGLDSIQILHQSLLNNRQKLKKVDAIVQLMDKVFYWAHNSEETKNVMGLLRELVDRVPTYDLYFKKDDTFWELIS